MTIGGNATVTANSQAGAGIGGNDADSAVGNIMIGDNSTVTATSIEVAVGVTSNYWDNDSGNITVETSNLTNADSVVIASGSSGTVDTSQARVEVSLYTLGLENTAKTEQVSLWHTSESGN